MTLNPQLIPVSYHLRHFNKYDTLDLPAAANGNMTLIGENAVGKTTLANCFFPMLVDGSIATPSFNPAKSTDKVSQSATARNSQRDTRTFDSMLLGWGPGALKVRTGYSYVLFRSVKRQVILGLGARRVSGETRQHTWWFVVISDDAAGAPLTVVTTDDAGQCLEEKAFQEANGALGDQLQVFTTAVAYRDYVATHIYGFSDGKTLGLLANDYRLLASPTLTSGNEKFSPIKGALKNAQEGIDPMVIAAVANSQRDVNQYHGLLRRIEDAQRRLRRMKNAIFLANLNYLEATQLRPYNQAYTANEQAKEEKTQAEQEKQQYETQLTTLTAAENEASGAVKELQRANAEQAAVTERRRQYADQIKTAQDNLSRLLKIVADIQAAQAQAADLATAIAAQETQAAQLIDTELTPRRVQLMARSSRLSGLAQVMARDAWADIRDGLARYLRQMAAAKAEYDHYDTLLDQLSRDVAITHTMQDQMGQSIDRHVQGFASGRAREDLQADNQAIHEGGASQMSSEFAPLRAKQAALLTQTPDLKVFLTEGALLPQLQKISQQITPAVVRLTKITREKETLQQRQDKLQGQIAAWQQTLPADFDAAAERQQIEDLQAARAALVIDTSLPQRLAAAQEKEAKLNAQIQQFTYERDVRTGRIESRQADIKRYTAQLKTLGADIMSKVTTLAPYFPEDVTVPDIEALQAYIRSRRSDIRGHSYADLGDQIGRAIHRHDGNGEDRSAVDVLFAERDHPDIASAMRQQRSIARNGLTVVAFDLNGALALLTTDHAAVTKALNQSKTGNAVALHTYLVAAVQRISAQYAVITEYNQILAAGAAHQHIKLKVGLSPAEGVKPAVIDEACDPELDQRPHLAGLINQRLNQLANNTEVADDEAAFLTEANRLLDTRQWSDFNVYIRRRDSAADDFELVDDKFVQSGGSGAEKAQAMVLPLLLVPKMVLQRAKAADAPHLVMFDEFADKLDPETAKAFAKTIVNFGFSFIATMPSGGQNKLLADGVDNIVWEVVGAPEQGDGRFHLNRVEKNTKWKPGEDA